MKSYTELTKDADHETLPTELIAAADETGKTCGELMSKTWLTKQLQAMGDGDNHLLSCLGDLSRHQLIVLRDRIAVELGRRRGE